MTKARDLGVPFEGRPGPYNAITDVPGVEVGQTTIIKGEGRLQVGVGPVRTGVTVVLPRGKHYDPVFAAWYSLNGAGEMTGTTWLEESGFLESGIALTNTISIGTVHSAMITWAVSRMPGEIGALRDMFWFMPVVTETNDYALNDISGFHVKAEDVYAALDNASGGPVAEGNVGGGTGMMAYQFKGGTGTASRVVTVEDREYNLGVLVQANFGDRETLTIAGVPVGKEITDLMPEIYWGTAQPAAQQPSSSSIIILVAMDAPLLPTQLKRITRRIPMGLGRSGGNGYNGSGDIFLAFSTANQGAARRSGVSHADFLQNASLNPIFEATVQATEEAIVNALTSAESMSGINGNKVYALPHDRLVAVLKKYNRFNG